MKNSLGGVSEYICIASFVAATYFCFEINHWIITSAAIIFIRLLPCYRKIILAMSGVCIALTLAGNLRPLLAEYLSQVSLEPVMFSVYFGLVYACFICFSFFFQKYVRSHHIFILTSISIILVFLRSQSNSGLMLLYLDIFIFLVAHNFFTCIFNADFKRITFVDTVITQCQIWTVTTVLPIPIQLIEKHQMSADFLKISQRKGLSLLLNTMFLAGLYGIFLQLLGTGSVDLNSMRFNFKNGSSYEGLKNINAIVQSRLGTWLGMLFIGFGVFTKITITMGYTISILRMCGFNMPSNLNRRALFFKNFRELMQGFYYYYNYLLINVFFKRFKEFWSSIGRLGLPPKNLSLLFTVVVGGVFFNTTRFGIPVFYQQGLSGFLSKTMLSIVFFLVLGLIVLFSDRLQVEKEVRFYEFKLIILKSFLILILSFLLLLKTSQFVPKWDSDQLLHYFSHLIFR